MDFGSSHVYEYENSDEEYISDEELSVGMFLSDDDDSDVDLDHLEGRKGTNSLPPTSGSDDTSYDFLREISNDETPSMKDIDNHVVEKWATKWKKLGSQLNIGEYVIRNIEYDHPNDCERCCRKMLSKWLDQTAHPTWGMLKTALDEISNDITGESKLSGYVRSVSPPAHRMAQKRHRHKKRTNWFKTGDIKGRTTRQADTNIIAVKFNTLTEPSHMHTGDAVVCSNKDCTAILSHLSKLKENPETGAKTWQCEFCGTINATKLELDELPSMNDTMFMITPIPVNTQQGGGESLIIFCVDISGSMCVTTEVSGKFQLKGRSTDTKIDGLDDLDVNGEDQYIPGQKRDVTYVSRLQSVQVAVDHQLGEFAKSQPNTKISLVTFNNEVTVFGDNKSDTVVVTGDKLNDNDALVKVGTEVTLPANIKKTRKALSSILFSLEESGSTALGPALIISIAMAARVSGSRVVVCTDGLANVGLGDLDELHTEEQVIKGQQFYEKLGIQAVAKGVTVSVVSIKGTDCRIIELGQVANQTGGEVTIVDPLTLTQQFSSILANPIIATNVVAKLILHSRLYLRHENYQNASCVTIQVGNVTADTELTYEYGVRSKKKNKKNNISDKKDILTNTETDEKEQEPDGGVGGAGAVAAKTKDTPSLLTDEMENLPFQLQIFHKNLDGAQCNRVITQTKPVTKDRQVAEAGSNVQVLGVHVAKTTARMALEGEYTRARTKALVNQRLVQRVGHTYDRQDEYRTWVKNVAPMENVMRKSQKKEIKRHGHRHSEKGLGRCSKEDGPRCRRSNDESPLLVHSVLPTEVQLAPKVEQEKAYKRRGESSDAVSQVYYRNMNSKASDFQ